MTTTERKAAGQEVEAEIALRKSLHCLYLARRELAKSSISFSPEITKIASLQTDMALLINAIIAKAKAQ